MTKKNYARDATQIILKEMEAFFCKYFPIEAGERKATRPIVAINANIIGITLTS